MKWVVSYENSLTHPSSIEVAGGIGLAFGVTETVAAAFARNR